VNTSGGSSLPGVGCRAVLVEASFPALAPSQVVGGRRAATRFSGLFSPNLKPVASAALPDFPHAVDDLRRADGADLKARAVAQQARRLVLWLMRGDVFAGHGVQGFI